MVRLRYRSGPVGKDFVIGRVLVERLVTGTGT